MNEPQAGNSPEGDKVNRLVSTVVGQNTMVKKTRKTTDDHKRIIFARMIDNLCYAYERQALIHHQFELDIDKFEEVWFDIVDDIFKLSFTPAQINLINFYIYNRFDEQGEIIPLHGEDGTLYLLQTAEDLYEMIKIYK